MRPNYPRNCWYVAARSDEVGRELLARQLLDRPVVLFREQSGAVIALEDRCAHRAYPLSKGRLDGDRLVCGYHGFEYDTSGACVRVPSQAQVAYGVCVHAFPVREQPPFVWIWMGEPGRSAMASTPHLPWLEEGWASSGTGVRVAANYMLVHEHYLDLTHIMEMHRAQAPPELDALPPLDRVNVSETSVTYSRGIPPSGLADWEAEATGLPRDRDYARHYQGTFLSPAVTVESWDIDDGNGKLYSQARIQAVSPESPTSTHLFWEFARNYETERELVGRHLNAEFEPVMRQDVEVLETIQAHAGYEAAARGAHVSADAGVLKVRAIVRAMLAAEASPTTRGTRFPTALRA
jgi:vanillate O-demethylase monooxygenase subunit